MIFGSLEERYHSLLRLPTDDVRLLRRAKATPGGLAARLVLDRRRPAGDDPAVDPLPGRASSRLATRRAVPARPALAGRVRAGGRALRADRGARLPGDPARPRGRRGGRLAEHGDRRPRPHGSRARSRWHECSTSPPVEKAGSLSRREVARRLFDGPEAPLARLASEHSVDAVAFARSTAPASLPALAQELRSPGKPDDPNGRETDWQPALAEALRSTAGDAPVLGVVLLTDGRQNVPAAENVPPAVDRLAARGVPVFPILIGSTSAPRDAAIAAIKAPESVYRGDVAGIEATLKIDGYPGREVAVTLERPNASPMKQVVRAPADARSPRPVVVFPRPARGTRHGRADPRRRAARRRHPPRQRPPDDHDPGGRRQGRRPAGRRRGALGVPLPPQRPGARPARLGQGGRAASAAAGRIGQADLRNIATRPRHRVEEPARPARRLRGDRDRRRGPGRPFGRGLVPARVVRRRAGRDADPRPRPEVLVGAWWARRPCAS